MQAVKDADSGATIDLIAKPETGSEPSGTRLAASAIAKLTSPRIIAALALSIFLSATLIVLVIDKPGTSTRALEAEVADRSPAPPGLDSSLVRIADHQTQTLKLETVGSRSFRAEKITTGKIGFNEDVMTPVFSPYTGRVVRLLAKPGDIVKVGSPLLEIDTPDLVQAEQDLIAASIAVPKAKTVLDLAARAEDRQHRLYLNKAAALKDWEQAEADVKNAERDLHSAENAVAGARSKLRVFGKTGEEIEKLEADRVIDRVARIPSPLSGTIVSRKVGPGQFAKSDSLDPLFTIANLSTVWLLADVYESDVPLIKLGQAVEVRVAAYPNESFRARVAYIGASVDPATHRVPVRSVVENHAHKLKPEMFASFRVATGSETQSLAVPVSAIVRDGGKTSVWIKQEGNQFSRHEVTIGLEYGGYVQILSGLQTGDQVVAEGSIFISNVASS